MKNSVLHYSVGALLYCPANNESIATSIITEKFGQKFSLALCLEDTINDEHVKEAENILIRSLQTIYEAQQSDRFYIPKIFIRVRCPEQIILLTKQLGEAIQLLSGFIAPKFSLENVDDYIGEIKQANALCKHTLYLMPIFESATIVNLQARYTILYEIKKKLDAVEELILNIRVGGNDLMHIFGLRRRVTEAIHDAKPVANILTDIYTVYGTDYVVSGPVWEYYNGDGWETGLKNELAKDLLCGFVGKTVIHPNQIPIVNDMLRIPQKDLDDAKSILNWDNNNEKLVAGSISKERMNECKTHSNWAYRTILMAEYYGTK